MKLSIARVDVLIWTLIYGGMFGASLGFALGRNGESYGWGIVAVCGVAILVGVILVWLRSRMHDPAGR